MLSQLELEMNIFVILAEGDIKTLSDQKEVCRTIAELLAPPNITKLALTAIIKQLRSCRYTCEAGPLERNTAFLALVELAQI